MKEQPAVSIYIVTYLTSEERCGVLKNTCEWALKQRYSNFEVVVSDNGGSISAVDALKEITDPRLKVCLNPTNEGFPGNINRCLEHCSNEIIKPICDDDLMHPDFLACTVPLVNDETMVVADVKKFEIGTLPDELSASYSFKNDFDQREKGYRSDMWHLPYAASCIPSATLYTKSFFKELGGFDHHTVISDWDFMMEACLYKTIVHVKQCLCYVGVWPGSLTEEMASQPYFFPAEGLYTKFRMFHGKNLPSAVRKELKSKLMKEWRHHSVRSIKGIINPNYAKGYFDYSKRMVRYLKSSASDFSFRPH